MPKKILATLLSSVYIMTGGGSAYAQMPPQDMQQNTPKDEAAPKPEVPGQIATIMIENNRLSVEFSNKNFGEILQAIGQKAGFTVEGSSNVFSKKVTTKFTDLDIDKGIIRLFSLVKETNYLINYDTKGTISKLKIYKIKAVGSTGPIGSTPTMPYGSTGRPPSFRSRQHRSLKDSSQPAVPSPPPSVPQVPQAQQPNAPDPAENIENKAAPDEKVKEIPYIPPRNGPVGIPPVKR